MTGPSKTRTIVMPDDLWRQTQIDAAHETIRQGRKVSVSEYIRAAIQSYHEGLGSNGVVTADPGEDIPSTGDENTEPADDLDTAPGSPWNESDEGEQENPAWP